jgi:hypothetical protein
VRVEPELARSEFCAGCHQFNFPRPAPLGAGDEPMQDTLAEWRRSAAARDGRTCQACHLDGHRFPGAHDAALLDRSIAVRVERRDAAHVLVTARATGAGHRVPTGDPFRRLRVELCAEPTCAEPLARPLFARLFQPEGESWKLASDTTVAPPALGATSERTIAVRLQAPPPIVYWRAVYAYAAPSTEPDLDRAEYELELGHGQVR